MDVSYSADSASSETIDTEIIKTHFPRDNNDKVTCFGKYLFISTCFLMKN